MSQGCQSRSSGPFFPVQLLIRVLRCAILIIAHHNTLEEGESRPQVEKGTLQVGMRLPPIKVPTDQKLYMVSFERNRGIRCFDSETIGATALTSPSPGRLF